MNTDITAITELIDKAKKFKQISQTGLLNINEVIKELESSLEKERYQIMGAYSAACVCGYLMTDTEYYEGQYKTNL